MTSLVRVPFHGDELLAVQDDSGVWVSVRRVCEMIGVDFSGQRKRLLDEENADWATVEMKSTVAEDGKTREAMMIHREALPFWMVQISPSKVAPESREMIRYLRREAAQVLADHFLRRDREVQVSHRISHFLATSPEERGKMYEDQIWRAIEALYIGAEEAANLVRPRRCFRKFVHMLAVRFLGRETVAELRKLNPEPEATRDYAFFRDPVFRALKDHHLRTVKDFAEVAIARFPSSDHARRKSFWANVDAFTHHVPQIGEPDPVDKRQMELFPENDDTEAAK